MRETTNNIVRELIVAFIIIFVFLFIAALFVSFQSRVSIPEALQLTLFQVITIGGGGTIGNIAYAAIIFFTLGIIYCIFDRFVSLITEMHIIGGILMAIKLSTIKDHYIVCGAGRVGIHVADKLKEKKEKFIVIENDPKRVRISKEKGFSVLEGDCTNENVLIKARIKTAKGLIACMGKDDANVFLVLTSKDLNSDMKVATRVNDLESMEEFRRAGADIIVAPEVTGGHELAEKITGKK